MCDGVKLLSEFKKRKPAVKCTADSSCWCGKLRHKFTHEADQCLSPRDMLAAHSALLCDSDKNYLISLSGREFICD